MATTYTLITSATVSNSTTTSVALSSIPQTYTDLVLRASIRNDTGYAFWVDSVSFGPFGSYTRLSGDGSSAASNRNTGTSLAELSADAQSATTNTFASLEAYIPNYTSTSTRKAWSIFSATEGNTSIAGNAYINAIAKLSDATSAVSSITISPWNSTYIASGSSFYLYGVKNS